MQKLQGGIWEEPLPDKQEVKEGGCYLVCMAWVAAAIPCSTISLAASVALSMAVEIRGVSASVK